jgi:DNA-binding transcriptional ArsR family regulator
LNNHHAATARLRGRRAELKSATALKVSDDTITRLVKVFGLLADESRMKILMVLAQDGEVNVSALVDMLKSSQPAVSHHLTLMRMANLVSYRREGKNNFYRLECSQLRELLEQVFADCGNVNHQIRFADFALAYKRGK